MSPTNLSTLKMLVIENHPETAQDLEVLLELWGHEIRVAFDGLDALVLAHQWEPDVVICDLGLPSLRGFGVAPALRSSGTRLIAVTGYNSMGLRRLALACGFEAVLCKPVRPELLEELLNELTVRTALVARADASGRPA